MGSSTSKATRKLPTTAATRQQPAWAGTRTPAPGGIPPFGPSAQEAAGQAQPSVGTGGVPQYGRIADAGGLGYATGSMRNDRGASEDKTADIQRDAQDPDFLAALSRLGQVSVPKPSTPYQMSSGPGMRTLQSRTSATSSPTTSRTTGYLSADQLSALLDRLKTAPAGTDPASLSKQFGLSDEMMRDLRRWVNSPSVDKDRTRVEVNEQGEETVKMMAVWVDKEPAGTDSSKPMIQQPR